MPSTLAAGRGRSPVVQPCLAGAAATLCSPHELGERKPQSLRGIGGSFLCLDMPKDLSGLGRMSAMGETGQRLQCVWMFPGGRAELQA